MCAVCKNNNHILYDFAKISLFVSYIDYPYNTIYNILLIILVKWYELSKVLWCFPEITLLTHMEYSNNTICDNLLLIPVNDMN